MAEYIRREAAINWIYKLIKARQEWVSDARAEIQGLNAAMCGIEDIPAADVAPVRHGRWLSKEYMYGDPDVGTSDMWIDRLAEPSDDYAYCSACGEDAGYNGEGTLILSNYCPRCGARMEKQP